MDMGAGRDSTGCKYTRRPQRIRKQGSRDGDESAVGLPDDEHRKPRRRMFSESRRKKAGTRARTGELAQVFRVVEERQVAWAGGIEGRDIGDDTLARCAPGRLRPRDRGNVG